MCQERFEFRFAHRQRVALVEIKDVLFNPVDVGLFGTERNSNDEVAVRGTSCRFEGPKGDSRGSGRHQMSEATCIANTVQKLALWRPEARERLACSRIDWTCLRRIHRTASCRLFPTQYACPVLRKCLKLSRSERQFKQNNDFVTRRLGRINISSRRAAARTGASCFASAGPRRCAARTIAGAAIITRQLGLRPAGSRRCSSARTR